MEVPIRQPRNTVPEEAYPELKTVAEADVLGDFLRAAAELENALSRLPGEIDGGYYSALRETADSLLPELYRAYDAYLMVTLEGEGKSVTCKAGCSACCRHFVDSVEPIEIAFIHAHVRNWKGYPDLLLAFHRRNALFGQIRNEESEKFEPEAADDRALYRYFLRGNSCPFLLSGGACGIYAIRPMSCRMFFSEGPPRFCEGKAVASPWNRNFHLELPEAAERALARCSGLLQALCLPEGLFPGLLAANALWGKYDGQG